MRALVKAVTLTNSLGIYASGDQVDTIKELENFFAHDLDLVQLESISVIDKAKQSASMDILFFDRAVTVSSSDNVALNIADADMAEACLGKISILNTDFGDMGGSTVATVSNKALILKNNSPYKAKQKSLFVVAVVRGTPTYLSTTDLTIKLGCKYPNA